jgi:membrane-bound lytic murein transglycosylase MltF
MTHQKSALVAALLLVFPISFGCGKAPEPAQQTGTEQAAMPESLPVPADAPEAPEAPEDPAKTAALSAPILKARFTGDLDEMIKRRVIRVGTVYSKTGYFIDKGVPRGGTYDGFLLFEDELNKALKSGHIKVFVTFVLMRHDELLPALVDGRVDVVGASLTATPERRKIVDFSDPVLKNVDEIVVTGPGSPAIASVDDLAGKDVFVRTSSSYYESLVALNQQFAARKLPAVTLKPAPEEFEDEDLLEMVNAGLVGIVVVDNLKAAFWKQIFPDLTLHPDVAVRRGGTIAVAMRKNSPKLMAAANAWVKRYGPSTAFGNQQFKKYLESTRYVRSATNEQERQKFLAMLELFRKYGDQYKLDYLLMAAQGFQESRLDQNAKSHVGAIGVMQVMPATGKDLKVGDITQLDPNIHAGVKYIRFMIDKYFKDEPMTPLNKGLFAFAAYNAGPGRVAQLRKRAAEQGLDPNVWFNNVERVAAERIGRETVQYVSNIYKYYIAYKLTVEQLEAKKALKQ